MKVLLCSPLPPTKELGGAKVYVELQEALQKIGVEADLITPIDVCPEFYQLRGENQIMAYANALKSHIQVNARKYDVIDLDYHYLPFQREDFLNPPILVARSVLLIQHLLTTQIPKPNNFKNFISTLLNAKKNQKTLNELVNRSEKSIRACDYLTVSNPQDKALLVRRGFDENKITVCPYGISEERQTLFSKINRSDPRPKSVCFVGTFDFRKGAHDLPKIFQAIHQHDPEVSFTLLGWKGLFQNPRAVKKHFSPSVREKISLIDHYTPEELPSLLSKISIGVFPSYLEGFPFSVLEMLASGLPVLAYESPGLPSLLPRDSMAPLGNWEEIAKRVIILLNEKPAQMALLRETAWKSTLKYSWTEIAKQTLEFYSKIVENKGK